MFPGYSQSKTGSLRAVARLQHEYLLVGQRLSERETNGAGKHSEWLNWCSSREVVVHNEPLAVLYQVIGFFPSAALLSSFSFVILKIWPRI
jgi:hypothetical protein